MSDKQTGVEVYQAESLLCECPVQQKPLLDMEGSAIIKILPRTLPPQPVYQTFLPVFQGGSGNETKCMCSASDARYIKLLWLASVVQCSIVLQPKHILFHSNKHFQGWCCGKSRSAKTNTTVTKSSSLVHGGRGHTVISS